MHPMWRSLCAASALVIFAAAACRAESIYVDNRIGRDVFDGTSDLPLNNISGPVRSLGRALVLAHTGDTIVLKNNQFPYYDSLSLDGGRNSGRPGAEFTIVGNGSVLDGSQSVAADAWKAIGEDLWKLTPWRKGSFLLLLDERPVPEAAGRNSADELPPLSPGQWCAWRGSIVYRCAKGDPPSRKPFQVAVEDVGISLFAVENVVIRDLTLRHFRLDGINAHDRCRNVVFENVHSLENGRAGLFVGGSAKVVFKNGSLFDNRKANLLLSELGIARLDQTRLSSPIENQQLASPAETRSSSEPKSPQK